MPSNKGCCREANALSGLGRWSSVPICPKSLSSGFCFSVITTLEQFSKSMGFYWKATFVQLQELPLSSIRATCLQTHAMHKSRLPFLCVSQTSALRGSGWALLRERDLMNCADIDRSEKFSVTLTALHTRAILWPGWRREWKS